MDMARVGAREQKIERIEIGAQAIVVDRIPIEQKQVGRLPRREGAALLRVQHGTAPVLERHSEDVRPAHINAEPGAAVEQMRQPHLTQAVVVLVERKPVKAKRNTAATPHHFCHWRDARTNSKI